MTAFVRHRDRDHGLTTAHMFCGIGGDTAGFAEAGFTPVLAANHSARNIETHSANFPGAEHLCADMDHYDMRRLVPARGLWASPICTEISPAGGKKRSRKRQVMGQGDLLEEYGHVSSEQWERTRATAYDILRAVEIWQYDFVACENVIEFATDWPLYSWWLHAFRLLGYTVTTTCVSSAHIGDTAGNAPAPQWRDRWYGVFTRRGIPAPDLEPRPLALCQECGPVQARRSWKDPRGPRIGKYRQQYVYCCPNQACGQVVEPYVRPAISVLDLSDPGRRIGDRRRTPAKPEGLAPATIARIRAGLDRYAAGQFACPPMLVPAGGMWADAALDAMTGPMRTQIANPKGSDALVMPEPFLAVLRNHATSQSGWDPMPTVAAGGGTGGGHQAVVTPPPAFLAMLRGNANARSVMEPLTAVVAAGGASQHAMVVPYYSTGTAKPAAAPLDTVTTKARFAILSPAELSQLAVEDCYLRMVRPREYAAGQRFSGDYVLTGNQGEQIAGSGNAVSVNVARWIGERIRAVLDVREDGDR